MARIMILVVAYNAEATLASVLARIPAAVLAKVEEIVVFDDASQDRTYQVGERYREGGTRRAISCASSATRST